MFADFAKKEGETTFLGYTQKSHVTHVTGLLMNGEFVDHISEGDEGGVILAETPFYAEMGGQVGDTGRLEGNGHLFQVFDCISPYKGVTVHKGKLEKGALKVGDPVTATINLERRQKIANHHTATHLLHWALHKVIGEHVKQAGSVVDAERLRFDFSHHKPLSLDEIRLIEDLVNTKIRENLPLKVYELPYEEAQKREDIIQFFGEKYGSIVRVVDIDYSKELCGGTHTSFVGNIGLFRITKEGSIAAGIRRIEAVTGEEAEKIHRKSEDVVLNIGQSLKVAPHLVQEKIEKLLEENRNVTAELKNLRRNQLNLLIESLLAQTQTIGDLRCIIAEVTLPIEELRQCADLALEKLGSGLVLIGAAAHDKCMLLAKLTEEWTKKGFSAQDLIKEIAPIIEGTGGGKPLMAQGAGKAPQKLLYALEKGKEHITVRILSS